MRRFVKICGLRDSAGVAAAATAGADALGFVFAPSVREVTPAEAASCARAAPSGILRVAVMRHPAPELWQEVQAVFRPDVLQTDERDFDYLDVPPGIERWPVIREGEARGGDAWPACFVYEGGESGAGRKVDWQRAGRLARKGRMILAGGLTAGNVAEAIAAASPWGLDVSSGVEAAPGRKDPALIAAFIAAVRGSERAAAGALE